MESLHIWLKECVPITPAALAAPGSEGFTGWAFEAYPELSQQDMTASFRRMRAAGASIVWIGHSNPVRLSLDASEVGLSYAVYAAIQNPGDPGKPAAEADPLPPSAARSRLVAPRV